MSVKQHAEASEVTEFRELEEQFFKMAERVADRMQALVAEEQTRHDLLDLVPEDPQWPLVFIHHRLRKDVARVVKVLEFLACPSRRTLRNALRNGLIPLDIVDEELAAHDRATDSRYEQVSDFAAVVEHGLNRTRVRAAVQYEDTDLTATEIARDLGIRRSQVYAAVDWYRGLARATRDALAVAVWTDDARLRCNPRSVRVKTTSGLVAT